ncbi:MAG TPA: helix-turn-helix domain-containing protein [Puia sp.]|jgi:excisionase family DNA binding protein|nr:helix-turn-helix domain-containing protein [Puia sp.]
MDALFIPTENDFRKWIRDAVKECLENTPPKSQTAAEKEDPLISRKEIAHYLGISLVTLTEWMKRGLPFHKVRGRVFFQRSEVLQYVKSHRPRKTGI